MPCSRTDLYRTWMQGETTREPWSGGYGDGSRQMIIRRNLFCQCPRMSSGSRSRWLRGDPADCRFFVPARSDRQMIPHRPWE